MKKMLILLMVCAMAMSSSVVFAAEKGTKGASASAYEHASDNSVFNRVSDWFATIGKSEEEKAAIMTERKAQRAAARAEKKAQKTERKAEKKTKKAGKALKNKLGAE